MAKKPRAAVIYSEPIPEGLHVIRHKKGVVEEYGADNQIRIFHVKDRWVASVRGRLLMRPGPKRASSYLDSVKFTNPTAALAFARTIK